jgi:hypothetical protein
MFDYLKRDKSLSSLILHSIFFYVKRLPKNILAVIQTIVAQFLRLAIYQRGDLTISSILVKHILFFN